MRSHLHKAQWQREHSDLTLLLGSLENSLLYGALCNESVYCDLLGLTKTMGTVHGLLVDSWVPVTVIEDHLSKNKHTMLESTSNRCKSN